MTDAVQSRGITEPTDAHNERWVTDAPVLLDAIKGRAEDYLIRQGIPALIRDSKERELLLLGIQAGALQAVETLREAGWFAEVPGLDEVPQTVRDHAAQYDAHRAATDPKR